jgi:hypothetical protein
LENDFPNVEVIEIVHARFPCRSPAVHLYGYRFRVWKNQFSFGDICWDFSTRQWSWAILPGYELSNLSSEHR